MLASLRWLRVGVLALVGLALLTPLIALDVSAARPRTSATRARSPPSSSRPATPSEARLLPPDAQVETALSLRNGLLLDQNLKADLHAPNTAGARVHVGFVLVDRGTHRFSLPFVPTAKQREDAAAALLAAIAQRDGKHGEVILERFEQQWKITGVQVPGGLRRAGAAPLVHPAAFRPLPPPEPDATCVPGERRLRPARAPFSASSSRRAGRRTSTSRTNPPAPWPTG